MRISDWSSDVCSSDLTWKYDLRRALPYFNTHRHLLSCSFPFSSGIASGILSVFLPSARTARLGKGPCRQQQYINQLFQHIQDLSNLSCIILLASLGSIFPLLIFITSPINRPRNPFLPDLYCFPLSGKREIGKASGGERVCQSV